MNSSLDSGTERKRNNNVTTEMQEGKREEIARGRRITGEENHCEQPVCRSIAPVKGGVDS